MSLPSGTTPSSAYSRPPQGLVVIGNFDGVHRGHQHVLSQAKERARQQGLALRVLTFDPHPRQVVTGAILPVLTPTERKCTLLEQLGLGLEVVVYPFSTKTAQLSPEEFCREVLGEQLAAKVVVVGQNFRFGRGRTGDLATLARVGAELGMLATAETLQGDEQGTFSSTRVRDALAQGDVEAAALVLGRPHLISGRVVQGDQRGRTLGFPTANLSDGPEVLPAPGVYAGFVYDLERSGSWLAPCALNIGARPTVERPHAVEAHLLGFSADLYGRHLGIELLARVRGIQKFGDLTSLRQQIDADVRHVHHLVSGHEAPDRAPGYV